jgi:hypothetical protein
MSSNAQPQRNPREAWKIRIYIKNSNPKHVDFVKSVQEVCRENGVRKAAVEIVNVESKLSEVEQKAIIALPMLVRVSPGPVRRILGITQRETLQQSLGFDEKQAAD